MLDLEILIQEEEASHDRCARAALCFGVNNDLLAEILILLEQSQVKSVKVVAVPSRRSWERS